MSWPNFGYRLAASALVVLIRFPIIYIPVERLAITTAATTSRTRLCRRFDG
jgi:hypothetical protein